MTRPGSLELPRAQSQALARLQSLTGAHVSLGTSPPAHGSAGQRGRHGSSTGSGGTTRQVSLVADELPTISNIVLAARPPRRQLPAPPRQEEEEEERLPPSQASVQMERAATLAPRGNWQVRGLLSPLWQSCMRWQQQGRHGLDWSWAQLAKVCLPLLPPAAVLAGVWLVHQQRQHLTQPLCSRRAQPLWWGFAQPVWRNVAAAVRGPRQRQRSCQERRRRRDLADAALPAP